MEIDVIKTSLDKIKSLRLLFLHENNFQFIYNKCHDYGWDDNYLFLVDNKPVGYGSVWGKDRREDRDAIFEFYLMRPYRKRATTFFKRMHDVSGATFIECQSNDLLLTNLLYEHTQNVNAEAILFKDHVDTFLQLPALHFEKTDPASLNPNDVQFILKQQDEIVATGGLMLNYNFPYADVYYEVKEQHRQKGYGSLMAQELKKAAYQLQKIPAARCNVNNHISKATLEKAGFTACGYILTGEIK